MAPRARNVVAALVPLAIVACAQLQGLDGYDNVDCVDGAGSCGPDAAPDPNVIDSGGGVDTGVDATPTCAPCASGEVCDPKSLKCVECLPGTKDCAAGYFCDPDDTAGYKCVLGCGVVDDCLRAGFVGDGGADAGDAGDGGDAGAGTVACCNNRCVDTSLDGKNCGMCGNSCGVSGACCNSQCLDVVSTPTSCGGCGIVCSNEHITSPTCGARLCNGACDDGWGDCNLDKHLDGCETDIASNVLKCGACNKACSTNHVSTPVCTSGKCTGTCDGTFRDCNGDKQIDGCEVDISTDKLNCGGCDNVCSNSHITTPTCSGGTCNGACDSGYKDCDGQKLINGCEKHISGAGADTSNCGDCNVMCSNNHIATPTCNGTCNGTCDTGFADCDANKTVAGNGCETSIFTDVANCGACNAQCSSNHVPATACSNVGGAGKCTGTCETNWSDCDNNKLSNGCETKTDQDTLNCGGCGTVCTTAGMRNCISGKCAAGYGVTTTSSATFIDACSFSGNAAAFVGRTLNAGEDDAGTVFAFPPPVTNAAGFDFKFNGTAPTNFWVTSNGIFGFGATANTDYANTCTLPSATDQMIFGYWDDLQTRSGASNGICVAVTGAAPNRKLIATWADGAILDDLTTHISFSVILNEGSYAIDVIYSDLSGLGVSGDSATIGLQTGASPSPVTLFSCNQAGFVQTGTKLRYLP